MTVTSDSRPACSDRVGIQGAKVPAGPRIYPRGMDTIEGDAVRLRPITSADADRLVAIRSTPEVHRRWGGDDLRSEIDRDRTDDEVHLLASRT